MRTLLRLGPAILLTAVTAAGCGSEALPTDASDPGLSDDALTVTANRAPDVFTRTLVDHFPNPCIGRIDRAVFHQTVRTQFFETPSDPIRYHMNLKLRHDIVSDAGFAGKGVISIIENGNFETGEFTFTLTSNITMADDAGRRWQFHVLTHVTLRDGVVVGSEIEMLKSSCVGTPHA